MYFHSRWRRVQSDKGFFYLAAPFADNIVTKIGRCPSGRGPRDDAARLNRGEKSLRISGYVVRKKEGRGGMMCPVQETTPAPYLLFDVIYEGKRKYLVRKQCLFLRKATSSFSRGKSETAFGFQTGDRKRFKIASARNVMRYHTN